MTHTPPPHAPSASRPARAIEQLPGQDQERRDGLPVSGSFSVSPLYPTGTEQRLPELSHAQILSELPDPSLLRKLRRLRASAGFRLVSESVLLLQTLQLDLDCPPALHHYLRERLQALLLQLTGQALEPDELFIRLDSEQPWGEGHEREHYETSLSLSELALACFDSELLPQLIRARVIEQAPWPALPELTATRLFQAVLHNRWIDDYSAQVEGFWQRHEATWQALAKVSFLDRLAWQQRHRKISRDGYALSLDALGHRHFPEPERLAAQAAPASSTEVRLLSINGQQVPGLFQVRSTNTSHCFIHLLGSRRSVEYISDDPEQMARKLLHALNSSSLHRAWLEQGAPERRAYTDEAPLNIEAVLLNGDLFQTLARLYRNWACELPDNAALLTHAALQRPIERALSLAAAADHWQTRPSILKSMPNAMTIAGQLMVDTLLKPQGLMWPAEQVFVAYRRGTSSVPLGSPRQAGTSLHVPSEKPLNLAQALVSNYRVERPLGYLDEGGASVLYHDPSGKGRWDAARLLPLSAEQLESHIRGIDFLALMTERLDTFWEQQAEPIKQTLRVQLLTQAVISFKYGQLRRSGLDALVRALATPAGHWQALGFAVQDTPLDSIAHPSCAGLLVLGTGEAERCVLYQAGMHKAFIEFSDRQALSQYLRQAATAEPWRDTVLRYVPNRHQARLNYLLKVWAGVQAPLPPASLLRPWTDSLYNPDQYQNTAEALYRHAARPAEPLEFMRQVLKANALEELRQQVVTSRQVVLRTWITRLHRLQWLLAPMSLLMTPALVASLTTELGLVGLNIASASLPGERRHERHQVLLSMLSLGLLHLGPRTPKLLGALHRVSRKKAAMASTATRGLSRLNRHSQGARQTHLAHFFDNRSLLKRWTIAANPRYSLLAVHAWKLGRKFLLWTSERGQARTLVISSHGHYLPWSSAVRIPLGTEVRSYAPHGYLLADPGLHRVVNQRIAPFSISTSAGNIPATPALALPSLVLTDKLMAGTSLPGRLKNYSLSKFQTLHDESYRDISAIVRNSNVSPLAGQLPSVPMDVLTVRNRFGSLPPTLEDLFTTLGRHGIHYDRIFLVHCRCSAIDALLRRAPLYQPPPRTSLPPTPQLTVTP